MARRPHCANVASPYSAGAIVSRAV